MDNFLDLCRQAGLSTYEVQELLGASRKAIRDYEQGLLRPSPREIQTLRGLALCRASKDGTKVKDDSATIATSRSEPCMSKEEGFESAIATEMADAVVAQRQYASAKRVKASAQADSELTFYEFFAGGGMARAGLGPNWRCLFANDFDFKKTATYASNWGDDEIVTGDVAKLEVGDLPGAPALAWASFPCQDLSLAGMGAGLKGDRSGTFWPFFNLIKKLRAEGRGPRVIVLENVCGTLTSHGGKDFAAIADALAAESYRFGAMVIDAAEFVPQSRPRLFFVAVAEGVAIPKDVLGADASLLWHSKALQVAHLRLTGKAREQWLWWKMPAPPIRNMRFAELVEENPTSVSWHTAAETEKLLEMMSDLNFEKVQTAKRTGQLLIGTVYKRTRFDDEDEKVQRAEIRFDDIAGCLRTASGGSSRQLIVVVKGKQVRSRLLSSREAARLMGLSDDYKLPKAYNEAYHLTGDGVVVPVVRYLAENLLEPILANNKPKASSSRATHHPVRAKQRTRKAN